MNSQRLSSRTAFQGRVFRVDVDRVRLPHGPEADIEVVRHAGSVVLLPMPAPDRVILVRQYRYAVDRWVWELPAGRIDPGESPEEAARRECHEEVGLVPRRVTRLRAFFPTPGYCDEEMIFYRLDDLERPSRAAEVDEDEQLEPREFRIEEARQLLQSGAIVDMKTALGLLLV